jgi:beta-xylosidase
MDYKVIGLTGLICFSMTAFGQGEGTDSSGYYNEERTFVNPVLPGDHPDPTMIRVGNDFYHCGSSFHFTPYLPVYHSRDMVHWEVISRVVSPSKAGFVTDRPSAGIWQGAITHFYDAYWIYFSSGGQWFSKAETPYGPWSTPEKVQTNPVTGNLGYDNSIFVDDDGKPYMLIKNGQKVNRIQPLGRDGQLTDTVINLDWINARLQYSWAEGPVMCRRNGYYYYFPAGDVSGGQYVLRTRKLTSDSTAWERLGDFFKPVTDVQARFRRPNHISAPIQLADGSWWTIGQSYEKLDSDDWSGTGRQTSLYPVIWEGDRPWGMAPVSTPMPKPGLASTGIPWRSVRTDYFNEDSLGLWWHFLSRTAAGQYSLTARKGWVRLMPSTGRTHLVQKETDHYYTAVTRVDMDVKDTADMAGLYLTNGNQQVDARLYVGYGRRIFLKLDTAVRSVMYGATGAVWLKLEREGHNLRGYYSKDRRSWTSVGTPVSAAILDKEQPNWNSWVGTSVGLFAEGKQADFDCFICKDGFSPLAAQGYRNFYGVETVNGAVANTSSYGGWFMISGVAFGEGEDAVSQVKVLVSAQTGGTLEVWLDDLKGGEMVARIPVSPNGKDWAWHAATVNGISGSHDVFIKFPPGSDHEMCVKQLIFTAKK